jgi:membrane protein required for colicin V production
MENLNYFDVIVIALIVLLGLKGLLRGFIKEVFALVGIIGGVFIASRIAMDVGNIVDTVIPMSNNNTVLLVGFILSLIGVWIIAYVLGTIISKMFSMSGLGFVDRIFGFLFGAAKVFLLFAIIAYASSRIETFKNKLDEKLGNTLMYPILVESGAMIIKLDTGKLQHTIDQSIDTTLNKTKELAKDVSVDFAKEKINDLGADK